MTHRLPSVPEDGDIFGDDPLDRTVFVMDVEEWESFSALLEAPAQPNPKLDALLDRHPVWEK